MHERLKPERRCGLLRDGAKSVEYRVARETAVRENPGMKSQSRNPSRRNFLRAAALVAPLAAFPGVLRAAIPSTPAATRDEVAKLKFYHTHTSETLDIVYRENGNYLPDALAEVNRLLRDFRTGDVHVIDPALLDLLHDIRVATGSSRRYEIISAYRSPVTNRMLASRSSGVADRSLHIVGQAIDVRLPGVRTSDLRRAALARAGGGVGYYPESDFVHIDTGRVRSW